MSHSDLEIRSLCPYRIGEVHDKKAHFLLRNRKYPISIKSKCRCWGCYKLFDKVYHCTRCWFVKYCSKKCQKKHWTSHGGICRSSSLYYDPTKWARVMVSTIPFHWSESHNVYSTTLYLIDKLRIHPDNIHLDTFARNSEKREDTRLLFNFSTDDLLPFLERGLNPQEVVNNEYFFFSSRDYKNISTVLEYGTGELHFPQQDYTGPIAFLLDHGADANEIMNPDSMYGSQHDENILYLASAGYDFYWQDQRERSRLDMISKYNEPLANKVKKILKSLPEKIREVINIILIPDLGRIVMRYLTFPSQGSEENYCEVFRRPEM